jgi:hypothetical protein
MKSAAASPVAKPLNTPPNREKNSFTWSTWYREIGSSSLLVHANNRVA